MKVYRIYWREKGHGFTGFPLGDICYIQADTIEEALDILKREKPKAFKTTKLEIEIHAEDVISVKE